MRVLLNIVFILYAVIISAQLNNAKTSDKYVSELIQSANDARTTNRAKSLSYIQEALKLENEISDTTLLNLYRNAGIIYKDGESHYMALNYFYKELELQNKINPAESFFIENNIGGCYYLMGDYKKAREFWESAVKGFEDYSQKNKTTSKNIEGSIIFNNLAVLEKQEGNQAKALEMLKEFKSRNEVLKDTFNIIMAYENIADVYVKLNESNTALQSLHKGIKLSEIIESTYDLASLYSKTGELYLGSLNNRDSAFHYLQNSFDLSQRHSFTDIKLYSSEKLVLLYEKENNYQKALHYLHIAKSLSEENINTENSKKVNRLELEFNEKMKQNELLLSQKKRERVFIIGTAFLFFSSVIIFLMFKLQKSKTQKRIAENKLLAKQLEEKNKKLTSNAIQMIQSNEIIESTHKELRQLKGQTDVSTNKMLSKIIIDLRNGSQAFNKNEFEKMFMETDGDFFKRLLENFPALTKNELRLCAFLRLNLSSKEISAITQQSPHSIVVARSRLRKKLNLEENQSLTNFLVQY